MSGETARRCIETEENKIEFLAGKVTLTFCGVDCTAGGAIAARRWLSIPRVCDEVQSTAGLLALKETKQKRTPVM